jgi:hypothetical protein
VSAERLAVGDLFRCEQCEGQHPAELRESVSDTEYAKTMLYIRCGDALFYVGQVGLPARDPSRLVR